DELAGDFTLGEGSELLEQGFENFTMDGFGVFSPRLKAAADRPVISPVAAAGAFAPGEVAEWQGGTVKSVENLGEQSAAGLDRIRGVLLVDVSISSRLAQARLQAADVILACFRTATDDV